MRLPKQERKRLRVKKLAVRRSFFCQKKVHHVCNGWFCECGCHR